MPSWEPKPSAAAFRRVFTDTRSGSHTRSNDDVLARWSSTIWAKRRCREGQADPLEREKQSPQRRPNETLCTEKASPAAEPTAAAPRPHEGLRGLESLEEQIDECMTLAKNLDREGLSSVINLLRRARNEVVWKIGE